MSALEYTKRQGSRLIWLDRPSPAGSQRTACEPAAAMRRDNSTHSRAGPTCKSLAVTKNTTVFARRGTTVSGQRSDGEQALRLYSFDALEYVDPVEPIGRHRHRCRVLGFGKTGASGNVPSIHSMIESTAVKGIGNSTSCGRAHSGRPPTRIESTPSVDARAVRCFSVSAGRPTRSSVFDAMGAGWAGRHPQRGEFCGGMVAQSAADD